ncbi:hypothetical protein LTR15_008216 [Elasticomyces elasticus]|nr:hypothetical protein LTR15_008216 [Elasticomyces elasticus]
MGLMLVSVNLWQVSEPREGLPAIISRLPSLHLMKRLSSTHHIKRKTEHDCHEYADTQGAASLKQTYVDGRARHSLPSMETVTTPSEATCTPNTSTMVSSAPDGTLATTGLPMAESSDGAAAAAHAVFDTVELLEMILISVDAKTVLLSQQVCCTWRNVITRSRILKKNLFFIPATL